VVGLSGLVLLIGDEMRIRYVSMTMRYTTRQPLPFTFTFVENHRSKSGYQRSKILLAAL